MFSQARERCAVVLFCECKNFVYRLNSKILISSSSARRPPIELRERNERKDRIGRTGRSRTRVRRVNASTSQYRSLVIARDDDARECDLVNVDFRIPYRSTWKTPLSPPLIRSISFVPSSRCGGLNCVCARARKSVCLLLYYSLACSFLAILRSRFLPLSSWERKPFVNMIDLRCVTCTPSISRRSRGRELIIHR